MSDRLDHTTLLKVLEEAVGSGQFILRGRCVELEQALSARHGVPYTVVTSSPRAGLLLALAATGPGTAVAVAAGAPDYAAGIVRRLGAAVASSGAALTITGAGPDAVAVTGDVAGGTLLVRDLGPRSASRGICDAAAIHAHDLELTQRLRMLRNHGQDGRTRFRHHVVGFNARMDEICAAYLLQWAQVAP